MSSSNLTEMTKRPKGVRRRSTRVYHLGAMEDSVSRQKKWEEVVQRRLVDVWFSIHAGREDEPLYISEQVLETMVSVLLP
jgi:hypothetical protein